MAFGFTTMRDLIARAGVDALVMAPWPVNPHMRYGLFVVLRFEPLDDIF